jgi:hypothetical protein
MSKKAGLRLRIFFVVAAILLFAIVVYQCIPSAPRKTAELYGNYVLDCKLIHGEMTLFPNGTFTQTVTIKATDEVFSSRGMWSYVTEQSSGLTFGTLRLRDGSINVLKRPDELRQDYAQQKPSNSFMPAEYWFGRLILGRADDWPEWKPS